MRFAFAARATLLAATAFVLASCASGPSTTGGAYKVGNPYQINGVWYYPKEDPFYDETGIASWYGDDFHGRNTANGETFDMDTLTAAHRTLPMPTIVRVTNLDNGRSIKLRVNDRGPYARGRIIDVSRRAAKLLGFYENGTARVRVQFEGRADINGRPPRDEEEIAARPTDVRAAPLSSVSSSELAPIPGASAAAPRETAAPVRVASTAPVAAGPAPGEPDGVVTTVPVPPRTQLWVQAGAFLSRSNADRQARLLAGVGNAQVSMIVLNGKPLYRVRLGPIANVEGADALLNKVIERGQNGAQIVVD